MRRCLIDQSGKCIAFLTLKIKKKKVRGQTVFISIDCLRILKHRIYLGPNNERIRLLPRDGVRSVFHLQVDLGFDSISSKVKWSQLTANNKEIEQHRNG